MRKIDQKYVTSGDITKLDGTPVPDDEPLFLFRAQDKLLSAVLDHYVELCKQAGSPPEGIADLQAYVDEIKKWQADHPERTRIPLSNSPSS